MALITTTDAKTFLSIDDSDSDTAIAQLIPQAEALFYSLIKVDSLEEGSKTEIAKFDPGRNAIRFLNFPVTAINSIDGVAYSGAEWDDYLVSKNEVRFLDPDFLTKVKLGRIKVNYNYGYQAGSIPADLKLAILILVSGFYNAKENYGTTSCKIGQEAISFRDVTESEDFNRILKNYKKKFIYVI